MILKKREGEAENIIWTRKNLITGKTYLRKHSKTLHGRFGEKEAKAEGYIECMQVTPAGAVFFQSGNLLKLTDVEIEKEVMEAKHE